MGFSDNCVSAALQGHFKALIHLELEALLEPVERSLMYVIFVCLFMKGIITSD